MGLDREQWAIGICRRNLEAWSLREEEVVAVSRLPRLKGNRIGKQLRGSCESPSEWCVGEATVGLELPESVAEIAGAHTQSCTQGPMSCGIGVAKIYEDTLLERERDWRSGLFL